LEKRGIELTTISEQMSVLVSSLTPVIQQSEKMAATHVSYILLLLAWTYLGSVAIWIGSWQKEINARNEISCFCVKHCLLN